MKEPLYRDGAFYDAMNEERSGDVDFYVEEALRSGSPVLELACGTGRLAIPMAEAGLDIVGVDLSESMLARARHKSDRVEWIQADCKGLDLDRKFGLVLLAFNSLLLFHTRADFEAVCATVTRHLAPCGLFLLDIFNPNLGMLHRGSQERSIAFEFQGPRGGGMVTVEECKRYDPQTQINHVHWTFVQAGLTLAEEHLPMRCYYPQEIDALLHYNGFQILHKYGDFSRKPFEGSDGAQIFVCRLRQEV